jgi:hypothetical protein
MTTGRQRVYVYVDGFNLYYGSLQATPFRWLDLGELCKRLFPTDTVALIRYYTADVPALPEDPAAAYRQREYLRALATIPNLTIKRGFFRVRPKRQQRVLPLYAPNPHLPNPSNEYVAVWRKEEKGSDVNLATDLLMDAAVPRFDAAWVISNDADLAWPIERVRLDYKLPVGVFKPARPAGYPGENRPDSPQLLTAATEFRRLKARHLVGCMFPSEMHDAYGPIRKPAGW